MPQHTLHFRRSSSPHYPAAVALAAQVPGATVTGDGTTTVHAVPLDAAVLPVIAELLRLVAGWKGTALCREGERLPPTALQRVGAVIACWQDRQTSGLAELHCQGWGDRWRTAVPCRLLARALPSGLGQLAPADGMGARPIQGLAQRHCVTACPAYDAVAVVAGMAAHLRDLRRAAPVERWQPPRPADDTWLARLLDDVDLGDEV